MEAREPWSLRSFHTQVHNGFVNKSNGTTQGEASGTTQVRSGTCIMAVEELMEKERSWGAEPDMPAALGLEPDMAM